MVRDGFTPQLRAHRRALPGYMRRRSNEIGDRMQAAVRRHTPIGREIDPKDGADLGPSGALYRSVNKIRVHKPYPNVWRSGAYSIKSYVEHVEYGTRRHIIRPRAGRRGRGGAAPALKFWSAGAVNFARHVNHPGTVGHHMFLLGRTEIEATFERVEEASLTQELRRHYR